jgi:hypothetical protein
MPNVFQNTGASRPPRSVFNLSYEKKLSCDMGQLIPVMCDEVVPGDIVSIGNHAVVRMAPLVSPVMHEINIFTHYFFVPYRKLWEAGLIEEEEGSWEEFITGGEDGENADSIPVWEPTDTTIGSLWDYLGFPVGVDPDGAYPIDFPRRAYNWIYNEYYRDENLISEVSLLNEDILLRAWEKDYFTSSLPWQQRGTAPALPLSGTGFADFTNAVSGTEGNTTSLHVQTEVNTETIHTPSGTYNAELLAALNKNEIDFQDATTFDVADLRLAFQIQKWLELNARAGARYTEFLKAHFSVAPRDSRLQRPEYIGGTKAPIVISEVLQTSETDSSPQGNLAGHGISAATQGVGRYRVQEYGLIMGIMSIMPRTVYQQGINRQWLKETKYDFYFPEFANLSEQPVYEREVFCTAVDTENQTVFGFQGRYDEMRVKQSMVCGLFRTDLDHWHISRQFSTAPSLNQEFIECDPRKDIFAAPDEPGLLVSYGNLIKAIRPLPIMSNPGLIDH